MQCKSLTQQVLSAITVENNKLQLSLAVVLNRLFYFVVHKKTKERKNSLISLSEAFVGVLLQ